MHQSSSGNHGDVDESDVVYLGSQIDGEPLMHPFYFEVVDQIEGACLVMVGWLSKLEDSRYTTEVRTDIAELQMKVTMLKSSLETPSLNPELVRNYQAEWDEIKLEFENLKQIVDGLQIPTKRLRRTPSGDEQVADTFVDGHTS